MQLKRQALLSLTMSCLAASLLSSEAQQLQMGYPMEPSPLPYPQPDVLAPQYNAPSAGYAQTFTEADELRRLQAENHKLKYALDEAHQKISECCSGQANPAYRQAGPSARKTAVDAQPKPKGGIGGMIKNAYAGYQDRKQQEAEYQKFLQYNYPELYVSMQERNKDRESFENQQFLNRSALDNWNRKRPPVLYTGW